MKSELLNPANSAVGFIDYQLSSTSWGGGIHLVQPVWGD
jgi:hypothetical protein